MTIKAGDKVTYQEAEARVYLVTDKQMVLDFVSPFEGKTTRLTLGASWSEVVKLIESAEVEEEQEVAGRPNLLTTEQEQEIRARYFIGDPKERVYREGAPTHQQLADEYGVSRHTINRTLNHWEGVEEIEGSGREVSEAITVKTEEEEEPTEPEEMEGLELPIDVSGVGVRPAFDNEGAIFPFVPYLQSLIEGAEGERLELTKFAQNAQVRIAELEVLIPHLKAVASFYQQEEENPWLERIQKEEARGSNDSRGDTSPASSGGRWSTE